MKMEYDRDNYEFISVNVVWWVGNRWSCVPFSSGTQRLTRSCDCSGSTTLPHDLIDFILATDVAVGQMLHIYTRLLVLVNRKIVILGWNL